MSIEMLLKLAVALNATLSFSRPCQGLAVTHSKEIPDCKYGWDYYLTVNTFFYGYYDAIYPPSCDQSIDLTTEYLASLQMPPVGDNICFTIKQKVWTIKSFIEDATLRLLKSQGLPMPQISVKTNPIFIDFANHLLNEYRINPSQYHVMKIRRLDYHQFINCTVPAEIVAKFASIFETLSPEQQLYPWFLFGYVEEEYWQQLLQSFNTYFQSNQVGKQMPKFLVESELNFYRVPLREAFRDNYILVEMIQYIMNHAVVSVGTHPWEGRYHFCNSTVFQVPVKAKSH